MDDEIFNLKNDFLEVKSIVDKIVEIKTAIRVKLGRLKEIHTDLINDNDSKKIFLICLESFHFQYKAMVFDTENLMVASFSFNNLIKQIINSTTLSCTK